jgi:hypothetical protein
MRPHECIFQQSDLVLRQIEKSVNDSVDLSLGYLDLSRQPDHFCRLLSQIFFPIVAVLQGNFGLEGLFNSLRNAAKSSDQKLSSLFVSFFLSVGARSSRIRWRVDLRIDKLFADSSRIFRPILANDSNFRLLPSGRTIGEIYCCFSLMYPPRAIGVSPIN